jgi:FkbM family methyltransferase
MLHRPVSATCSLLCALSLILLLPGCQVSAGDSDSAARTPAADTTQQDTSNVYSQTTPSRDGIGKVYMGREISKVMGHRGAAWLERSDRMPKERPDLVVDSLNLSPDDVVADIGAGTGYFTFRIAPNVPEGRVLAVDIQPEMLDIMRSRMQEQGIENISLVKGTESDTKLPADSVDVALMVDAYHEFAFPREMMLSIREALRPGGRVVLIEYRKEDPSVPIKPLHKMSEAQVKKEMEAVGLDWVETLDMLPRQHFIIVEKPSSPAGEDTGTR